MTDRIDLVYIPCNSAAQFLDAITTKRIVEDASAIFRSGLIGRNGIIFRGQSDASKSLVPSALRKGNPLRRFCLSMPGTEPQYSGDLASYLAFQLCGEAEAVGNFLQAADQQGIDVSLDRRAVQLALNIGSTAMFKAMQLTGGATTDPVVNGIQ